jgi:MFS transporter, ACS family, D-galactonate transporter
MAGNAQPESEAAEKADGAPLIFLLQQPQVLGATIGFAAYNYVFYLVLVWLPSYLSVKLQMNILHSALYTSIPWFVATVSDLLIGGWMVDLLVRRVKRPWLVRQIVLIGGLGFGTAIYGAAFARTPWAAVTWISISMAGLGAMAPVGWSVPSFVAPPNSVGRVAGIMNFGTQLTAILAPVITGYFARSQNFEGAFALAAVVLAIGMAGYGLLLGRLERISLPVEMKRG